MIITGEYAAKLNAKNQVTLPAALRDALFFNIELVQLILFTREKGEFIEIYTAERWLEIQQAVEKQALESKDPSQIRIFNRRAHAFVMEKSGNGRILIPQKFIEFLNPSTDLVFVGNYSKIEIWNADKLSESQDNSNQDNVSAILPY